MGCLSFLFPPKLGDAELVVIQSNSANSGLRIPIKLILRSYKLTKQNIYAEIAIPGLSGAPLQFIRGQPKLLSMVLYFDSRDAGTDVRQLTQRVSDLMQVDGQAHTPPVLRFEWQGFSLKCVLESADEKIVSLFPDGKPSRARMQVALKEMRTQADLLEEENRE